MKTLILSLLLTAITLPAFAGEAKKVMYEVPAPDALVPYSRFEIEYRSALHSDGSTEIRYRMPAMLLGEEQEFRFRGVVKRDAASFTLSSANGEMKCEKLPAHTLCNVIHKNVKVDLEAVKATLDAMPMSIEEKMGRLELSSLVARREGGDMVGILMYAPGVEYKSK